MLNFTPWLLVSNYIPHGHCYLWQTNLVFLHVFSDGMTGLAYYSIPLLLLYFLKQREDVPFKNIFILFSLFILSCGTTHFLSIWTLWYPDYWVEGIVKGLTAIISIYTAFDLIPIIPKALSLPSPQKLERLNQNLAKQIQEKETAQRVIEELNKDLESRIQARTKELEEINRFIDKIINLIPDLVYIYDLYSQKIVYANNYLQTFFGYTASYMTNHNLDFMYSICHPEDINTFESHWLKFTKNISFNFSEIEYRVQDFQGKWHWLHSKNYIFAFSQEGIVQQIISISSDITQRKEYEIKQEILNRQLQTQVNELKLRNQEMIQLGKVNDFLQICNSFDEVKTVIPGLLQPLFGQHQGAIFIVNNQNQKMELACQWGEDLNTSLIFDLNDCWALRKGNYYHSHHLYPDLMCEHIQQKNDYKTALCLPMIAQGTVIGLLYLSSIEEHNFSDLEINLAQTAAKQIALTITNLRLQERLQYQSSRDPLTGLYNRRYLEMNLPQLFLKCQELNQEIGIIILDIDHFKQFNDLYGHQAGDLVLQKISEYLCENLRDEDAVCRYGGEEILIILPDISLQDLVWRSRELNRGIRMLSLNHQGKILPRVTASFGLSSYPTHGQDFYRLLSLADRALYLAKAKGRNRVICAKEEESGDSKTN